MIGCREKEPFEILRVRGKIANGRRITRRGEKRFALHEALLLEELRDRKHRVAFGHGDNFFEDSPAGDRVEHFTRRLRMIEKVFACLQHPARIPAGQVPERQRTLHHAVVLHQAPHHPAGCAMRYGDKHSLRREVHIRLGEHLPEPDGAAPAGEQKHQQ